MSNPYETPQYRPEEHDYMVKLRMEEAARERAQRGAFFGQRGGGGSGGRGSRLKAVIAVIVVLVFLRAISDRTPKEAATPAVDASAVDAAATSSEIGQDMTPEERKSMAKALGLINEDGSVRDSAE